MLFENVQYKDNLPFEISFLNIGEESKHCHRSLEILLVLRGVAHYQIYHTDYELNAGDLIIADTEDLHQIHDSSEDILILSMHIDTARFDEIYPDIKYMFFVCEECMEAPAVNPQVFDNKLALLKSQIAELAFHYIKEESSTTLLMEGINNVVATLVEHFQGFYMEDYQYKTSQQDMNAEDLQQLCRITRYIMLNYQNKISLDDIARMEHLSSYYLSHLIKENLGFNFQNFVNAIRLEFAEKELVFTNMTLMQISQDCGFSSPNYFNKCFSAWYGKTPSQYRRDYSPRERSYRNDFTYEEAFILLSRYLNDRGNPDVKALFISPEIDFDSKGFSPLDGPAVVLDSIESLLKLDRCREKLRDIHPSALIISESLLHRNKDINAKLLPDNITVSADDDNTGNDITASCMAEALDDILVKDRSTIFLLGSEYSLLGLEHIDSAAYAAYRMLFQDGIPQIKVCKAHVMVKAADRRFAVFFNTDRNVDMAIHLSRTSLPDADMISLRKFPNSNVPEAVKGLAAKREIPPHLLESIRQCAKGAVTFPDPKHNIDFTLGYMDAVILEFIKL